MNLFSRNKTGGFMDEIRCDEVSYLIWKWHPAGVEQGTGDRENAMGGILAGQRRRGCRLCL